MGLDISGYSNLRLVGKHTENISCDDDNHIEAYAYMDFSQSFRDITVIDIVSNNDGTAFLVGGCYEITALTKQYSFRAGSYGGYNRWRDSLRAFNPNVQPDLPFYELIWFADNEGVIGSQAASDLLLDFQFYEDNYMDIYDDYNFSKYKDWFSVCKLASENGLIQFH